MARAALDASWWPREQLGRPEDVGFASALQLLSPVSTARVPAGWELLSEQPVGQFRLRRLRALTPVRERYDVVAAFTPSGARATWLPAAHEAEPCVWTEHAQPITGGLGGSPALPSSRLLCDGAALARTLIDDPTFAARDCLWVTVPKGGSLLLEFPMAQLGERLVGHLGAPWLTHRDDDSPPLEVLVEIDGRERGRLRYRGVEGWSRFELALGGTERTGTLGFRFTPNPGGSRQVCLQAVIR